MEDIMFGTDEVWKSLLKLCYEGNIQAMKLYFELLEDFRDKNESESKKCSDDIVRGVVIVDDL